MIKLSIYPKSNSKKQNYVLFQLQVTTEGKRIVWPTGERCLKDDLKKYWKAGAIIQSQRGTDLFKLNQKFDRMKRVAEQAFEDGEDILAALDRMRGIVRIKPQTSAPGFYRLLDNLCIEGFKRVKKTRHELATASVGNYKHLRSLLKKFDKDQVFSFESWTVSEWERFQFWLETHTLRKFSKKNPKKGLSPDSIVTICRTLKAVINDGVDKDMTTTVSHKKNGFNAPEEEDDDNNKSSKNVYLTTREVERLYATPVPEEFILVRDLFCMASVAGGLRISDWGKMNKDYYTPDGKFIACTPKKTRRHKIKVRIFLTPFYKKISKKYNDAPPLLEVTNNIREGLRECCRLAGIASADEVVFHTARRNFINNAILARMPKEDIKRITGHRSDSFEGYVKLTEIESGDFQEQFYASLLHGGLVAV